MKHVLLRSTAFVRDSRRMLRKRPDLVEQLLQALRLLEADPYEAEKGTGWITETVEFVSIANGEC